MESHEMSLDMLGSAVVSSGMSAVLPTSQDCGGLQPHPSIQHSMMYSGSAGMMSPVHGQATNINICGKQSSASILALIRICFKFFASYGC